jgi:hypothetical protein
MTLTLTAVEVDAAREALRSEVRAFIPEALSKGTFVPDCDSWLVAPGRSCRDRLRDRARAPRARFWWAVERPDRRSDRLGAWCDGPLAARMKRMAAC